VSIFTVVLKSSLYGCYRRCLFCLVCVLFCLGGLPRLLSIDASGHCVLSCQFFFGLGSVSRCLSVDASGVTGIQFADLCGYVRLRVLVCKREINVFCVRVRMCRRIQENWCVRCYSAVWRASALNVRICACLMCDVHIAYAHICALMMLMNVCALHWCDTRACMFVNIDVIIYTYMEHL